MKKLIFTLLSIFFCINSFAKIYNSVDSIPDPKSYGRGYVSNPDSILTEREVYILDSLIAGIENQKDIQIAIVAVNSIGINDPFSFGVDLFEDWKIGSERTNSGLLLLVVMDVHSWRFHTGYGLESVLPDARLKTIGENYIVPEFRNGNFGKGIIDAIINVKSYLEREYEEEAYPEYVYIKETPDTDTQTAAAIFSVVYFLLAGFIFYNRTKKDKTKKKSGRKKKQPVYKIVPQSRTSWILMYFILPAFAILSIYIPSNIDIFYDAAITNFVILAYILLLLINIDYRIRRNKYFNNQEYADEYEKYKAFVDMHIFALIIFTVIFFPIINIPYVIWYFVKKSKLRNAPRNCSVCNAPMSKLNEKLDDEELEKGQILEEKLGSVDYDVWVCENKHAKVLRYESTFTRYEKCSSCGYKTMYLKTTRTITSATYSSTGKGEKIYVCKNCSHTKRTTFVIPRKTKSSSSGSSSGSSWSGGGSSWSGGGSSSWGGGHTGGGGAGGRW